MTPITENPASGPGKNADLAAGALVGEYCIEAKIGEGGFGAVYRATHPMIGKSAAVKVLSAEFSAHEELSARFVNEARAVNRINHGNIVDIFAFGTLPDGRLYFVMELLEGEPLDALLDRVGCLAFEDALPILRSVASAVDAAHAAGIVHRDLKPENVFLSRDSKGFKVKLLDFGIAKVSGGDGGDAHRTKTGAILGSPYYMSPEQARGQQVDHRTDVYSFGAMIHRMLTGAVPFMGNSTIDIVLAHVTQPPPRMSAVNAAVPPALDDKVVQMLGKLANERPASLGVALDGLVSAASSAGLDTHKEPSSLSLPAASSIPTLNQHVSSAAAFAATDVSAVIQTPPPPRPRSNAPLFALGGVGAIAAVAIIGYLAVGRGGTTVVPDPASSARVAAAASVSAGVSPPAAVLPAASSATASATPPTLAPASAAPSASAAPAVATAEPPKAKNLPPPKAKPKPTISPDLDRPP